MPLACTLALRVGASGHQDPGERWHGADPDTGEATVADDESLLILIRQKLQDGRLPRNSAARVWGGPGNGQTCHACGDNITKDQMGIEGFPSAVAGERPLRLHAYCFQIWQAEKTRALF